MLERIEEILRDYKGDNDIAVTRETTFESLELDSLDTVELVMNLEEEFEITIEIDDGIKTIGDLMRIIESAQG
ncbi:MAG: phosphopantetheine-binding protein [Oscillospiraceae bacterium]|nr:phosphopantetheine-binding protein [Oscillospiraceae bacterium]